MQGDPEDDGAVVLDARGQRCPLPVLRLGRLARELRAGSVVRLLATDPAARSDVAAFCRMRGHVLLETVEISEAGESSGSPGGDHTAYVVRVSATPAAVAR